MQFKLKVENLPELQRKLGESNFRVALKQGMENATTEMERQIKLHAPRGKTGNLRASFTHKVSADGTKGIVGSTGEKGGSYAPFVEFGTGVYVGKGRIYPKTAKALAWPTQVKGSGTVRRSIKGMKGRFYVKKAWDEEGGGKLLRFFTASFDEALRR